MLTLRYLFLFFSSHYVITVPSTVVQDQLVSVCAMLDHNFLYAVNIDFQFLERGDVIESANPNFEVVPGIGIYYNIHTI